MERLPQGEAASIKYLDLLQDDDLVRVIDFHARHFLEWQRTGDDVRVAVIYHGQILLALLEECDRRGKTPLQLALDIDRKARIDQAWHQSPGSA